MDDGFIDLGEDAGIAVGDELTRIRAAAARDMAPRSMLPEENVARMRVVRVTPGSATVRVSDASSTRCRPDCG